MYKRPPKHIERAKLTILYSIMTLSVIVVVILLVMIVGNYSYNRATGTFEQRGLVQLASIPSGATVEIDGNLLSSRTSTKTPVEPGERNFKFMRDGYESWELTTNVSDGSLVWLNYARLVPIERPVQTMYQYKSVQAAKASPNNRLILTQPDKTKATFRLIDISHDVPVGSNIELPITVFSSDGSAKEDDPKATYTLAEWDESSRYALVWRTVGKDRQLVVLNVNNPAQSVNVTQEFSMPITAAQFAGRSGNMLYVKIDGSVRKLDVSDGTVTRSLIGGVDSFALRDNSTLTYVSEPDAETGSRTAGIYRDGDSAPTVLKTVLDESKAVSLSVNSYYGNTYTVIAEGDKFEVYRGDLDQGLSGLDLIASRALDKPISSVEFNTLGSHILVRAGESFASYDIDRNLVTESKLEDGSSKDFFWLDAHHIGLLVDGNLTMRDLDGTNAHSLNAAKSLTAGLSRNGTYMYSFGDGDGGQISLQRIRMILR